MSASLSPAVPLFYSNTYADPPDCSSLPKPPESWYLKSNDENLLVKIKKKKKKHKPKQKSYYKKNNKGFYSPFYSTHHQNFQHHIYLLKLKNGVNLVVLSF